MVGRPRISRWTRLRTFFANQLFATAFFGGGILLNTPEAIGKLFPAGKPAAQQALWLFGVLPLPMITAMPLTITAFLTAGGLFFLAGLAYSLTVPGVISGYPNRGEFITAARSDTGFKEEDKRAEWERSNEEKPFWRLVIAGLVALFLAAFLLFLVLSGHIAAFALLGR